MARPRSSHADEAILLAAQELFEESGVDSVTMEAIARKAGVGKQTVYRRFRNRNEVLAAGWLQHAKTQVSVPRGDTLEADLRLFLSRLFVALESSGDSLRRLMGQAQLDDGLRAAFREEFISQRRETLSEIIERHVPTLDSYAVATAVDMLYGAMWYRLLTDHGPLDRSFARHLAWLVSMALHRASTTRG